MFFNGLYIFFSAINVIMWYPKIKNKKNCLSPRIVNFYYYYYFSITHSSFRRMDEITETVVRPRLSVQSGRIEKAEKEQKIHIDVVQIFGHRLIVSRAYIYYYYYKLIYAYFKII